MEGLKICPSFVEIMSVGNVSKNKNNEQNKVNYTEQLKKRTRDFVQAHDESKLKTRGRNHKDGTTLCCELKALRRK